MATATEAPTAGLEAGASAAAATRPKLHGRAFYESIGSPKYILAPMVDQSEFVGFPFSPRKARGAKTHCLGAGLLMIA